MQKIKRNFNKTKVEDRVKFIAINEVLGTELKALWSGSLVGGMA